VKRSQLILRIALQVGTYSQIDSLYLHSNIELIAQLHKLDLTAPSSGLVALSGRSNFFLEILAKLKLYDSSLKSNVVVGNTPQTISITSGLIGLLICQDSTTSLTSPIAVRRNLSHSIDQLQDLWQFVRLYANSMPQPRQGVGTVILKFLHTLQAVARRIASLRPKISFVQKYCLQWAMSVEDCLKMLVAGNEILPQSLFNSITELMLVSAREIPEIVVAINEQLGPLLQNEEADKPWGQSASRSYQVRNGLSLVLLYLADQLEVGLGRLAPQSQQLALNFHINRPTRTRSHRKFGAIKNQ
jgi:hypothetical protein